ncbi:MAG: hypothetical protein PVJ05_09265 [Candidatus Thorarchaeota archaeon]
MHLTSGITMFVLCMSVWTTTANATVSWQDDFSDPNLPGWTLFAYENNRTLETIPGNFSAADHTLKVLDDDISFARHNSTVNVGTWSFDMFVPECENVERAMYVYIMSNGSRTIPTYSSDFIGVGVWKAAYQSTWSFIVWTMNGFDWDIHSQIYMNPMQGWHHIRISRNSDGRFLVYFNGTLEADFTYNNVTISTYLEFYCYNVAGAAIDNLVVEYTPLISIDPVLLIVIGYGVGVGVIVLAFFFLLRDD